MRARLKALWDKQRTVIFAVALTAALAAAVQTGHYQASRLVFPLAVVWALVFHSADSRKLAERMEHAVQDMLLAQQACRAGDLAGAVGDIKDFKSQCEGVALDAGADRG